VTPDASRESTSLRTAVGRTGRHAWLARLALLCLAGVVTFVVFRLIGRIDWAAVGEALSHLAWWQPVVLLTVLLVRQVLNALPLALYIPGVSAFRATVNDLGAIVMGTVAPPPSDLALRMAMFSSWGVPTAKGLAGTLMNTLTFYIVRFGAPLTGFALLAVAGRPPGLRWVEVLSIAVAASILVGVLLVVRSEGLARSTGSTAARIAGRVRPSLDTQSWADACVDFRLNIDSRFRTGFPRSLVALCGMLVADLALLVLALRFVGLTSADVGILDIAIAYLFAYPFTLLPFAGIGVVDALIVAGLVDVGGTLIEAEAVAGLLVWRIFTIGGPILLGLAALVGWRRSVAASASGG